MTTWREDRMANAEGEVARTKDAAIEAALTWARDKTDHNLRLLAAAILQMEAAMAAVKGVAKR